MIIRSLASRPEFVAGDGTLLREVVHGPKEGLACGYSLARARLAPGETSLWHRRRVSEAYYILSGRGRMEIDDETAEVTVGDLIYIPPKAAQRITNIGADELAFLCIVDLGWTEEDEEIIELR